MCVYLSRSNNNLATKTIIRGKILITWQPSYVEGVSKLCLSQAAQNNFIAR